MSILINKETRVVVQGITGRDGSFHARKMKAYGTRIVAGVSPGKAGEMVDDIPVFNSVWEAVHSKGANTSVIFVPASFVKDAIMEAVEAGIRLIVCITEGVPTLDVIEARRYATLHGVQLIGPNCPGIISPEKSLVGIMPGNIFMPGHTGVISRSGTLTYEVVQNLTKAGLGQSTAVGVGGDPVIGLFYKELLQMFQDDHDTDSIVLIGEIGGDAEQIAAEYIKNHITKPVTVFIAGAAAPTEKRMGHAGAIISSGSGTAQEKWKAFESVGVPVAKNPSDIPSLLIGQLRG